MLLALRNTFFKAAKGEEPLSDAEIMAAASICNRYNLDPFLREVHCTRAAGRLLIMVGIDGWMRQAQSHKDYDGMDEAEYVYDGEGRIEACRVTVYRKDQSHPTSFTAYLKEWAKNSGNWQTQPHHMLFIKALKGAIRLAFGIGGIDMDDPGDFYQQEPVTYVPPRPLPKPVQKFVPPPDDDPFNVEGEREPGQEG